jgi:hypothetical protein
MMLACVAGIAFAACPATADEDILHLPIVKSGESLGKDIAGTWDLRRQEWDTAKDYGMRIASAPFPVRSGETSVRLELHRGDCGKLSMGDRWDDCLHNNERVELVSAERDWLKANSRGAYGWSIYLPPDWNPKDLSQIVLGQFHQQGDDHPAFQFFYQSQGGGLQVARRVEETRNSAGTDIRTIIPEKELRGRWHDIRVDASWRKRKDGYFRVTVNGTPAYDFRGQTLSGSSAYFKLGIYRLGAPLKAPDLVVYYDEIWRK